MDTRKLGETGWDVSVLSYGAMELRHMGQDQADRLLNAALDAGINWIDTAPDYGPSEEMIGRAIADRRDEFYLATKCGCNVPKREGDDRGHIWTRDQLLHNLELSLERLQTDWIDFWQIHSAEPRHIVNNELIEVMREVQAEGTVYHLGFSAPTGRLESGYRDILEIISWGHFDAYQIPYSAMARTHERSILAASAQGAGTIVRGTVRRGMTYPEDREWEEIWEEAKLDELLPSGEDRYGFLLRYGLATPGTTTVLVGTQDLDHLQQDVEAAGRGPLADDLYAETRRRLDAIGVTAGPDA